MSSQNASAWNQRFPRLFVAWAQWTGAFVFGVMMIANLWLHRLGLIWAVFDALVDAIVWAGLVGLVVAIALCPFGNRMPGTDLRRAAQ